MRSPTTRRRPCPDTRGVRLGARAIGVRTRVAGARRSRRARPLRPATRRPRLCGLRAIVLLEQSLAIDVLDGLVHQLTQLLITWETPPQTERVADRAAKRVVGSLANHPIESSLPSKSIGASVVVRTSR